MSRHGATVKSLPGAIAVQGGDLSVLDSSLLIEEVLRSGLATKIICGWLKEKFFETGFDSPFDSSLLL